MKFEYSQNFFGGRDVAALDPDGVAQGPGDALERGLDDVVPVLPRQALQVEGDPGRGDEGPEELLGQLGVERADLLRRCLDLVDEERAARQVDGHLDEGLVER